MIGTSTRILIMSSVLVASGCGIKKTIHQRALDGLAVCQGELGKTTQDRDELVARNRQLSNTLGFAKGDNANLTAAALKSGQKLSDLNKQAAATRAELAELRKRHDAAEKRLAEFNAMKAKFQQLVDTGKLKVAFRNGQMVLELPSEVLFRSGKAQLSKGGIAAIDEVLEILSEFKSRRFMVAGHTDNVPVKSRRFRNNWALSTARAVSVLDRMIEKAFDPKNLAATGYGMFSPVADNATKDGRAKNRRIEIVLVPDLSVLSNM